MPVPSEVKPQSALLHKRGQHLRGKPCIKTGGKSPQSISYLISLPFLNTQILNILSSAKPSLPGSMLNTPVEEPPDFFYHIGTSCMNQENRVKMTLYPKIFPLKGFAGRGFHFVNNTHHKSHTFLILVSVSSTPEFILSTKR